MLLAQTNNMRVDGLNMLKSGASAITKGTIVPARALPVLPTDHQFVLAPIRLGSLTYGELAVAICAAGLSGNTKELTTDQVKILAVGGIVRLGLAEVHRLNAESRAANVSYCHKICRDASPDVHAEEATIRRIWGSSRRQQKAVNLGWRLGRSLAQDHLTS